MVDAEAALELSADGELELDARAVGTLVEGRDGAITVRVTDLFPVTNAQVTGGIEGQDGTVTFVDDGTGPDAETGDAEYTATLPIPEDENTITLNVEVTAPDKNPAEESFELAVEQVPDNNDFADRIILEPGRTSVQGSNSFTSSEEGEPVPFGGGRTVWWQWNAPEDGEVTISTEDSDFDTGLAIFRGSSVDSLVQIASNDDASATFQSEVTFRARAGEAYHIQVDGILGATGAIVLNFPGPGSATPGGVFISSNPEDRTVRHNRPFTLSVEAGGNEPLSYQWFRFGTDETAEDAVPIEGATGPEFSVDFASREEDEANYFVRVSNPVDAVESESAGVTVMPPDADLPENDDFAEAIPLGGAAGSASEGTVSGDNIDATRQPDEPNHADAAFPQSSVWYAWEAPSDGVLRLNTEGSDFDTILGVYLEDPEAPGLAGLNEVAANDDAEGRISSSVEFDVNEGQTYFVALDGFDDAEGNYQLGFAFLGDGTGAGNDDFADRIAVPSVVDGSETVFGSNEGADGETGEPDHAGVSRPIQSVWWSWEAAASGPVEISTEGSNYDTALAVYRGSSVDDLSEVAANDDGVGIRPRSRVRFTAEAGETFAIAVDGFGSATGNIRLTVESLADGSEPAKSGILLVDAFTGFGETASGLRGLGFGVTSRINEAAADYPSLRDADFLDNFRWTIFAPRDTGEALSSEVVAALSDYVESGGHLLVTGFDSLSSPADPALAQLLGLADPGDLGGGSAVWQLADRDHPILNGVFGDFAGGIADGEDFDFDQFAVPPESDTLVLARLDDGTEEQTGTPRLTFRMMRRRRMPRSTPHRSAMTLRIWRAMPWIWNPESPPPQDFPSRAERRSKPEPKAVQQLRLRHCGCARMIRG